MIIGIGTDIVLVERIAASLQRGGDRFARRILTETEFADFSARQQPAAFLAKRFAVKEAAAKALGTGIGRGISFQDFEVSHDAMGRPLLHLSGGAAARLQLLGGNSAHLSLADEKDCALAFVVLEG
jgi:holo-[acyl-carrier protein] synthase